MINLSNASQRNGLEKFKRIFDFLYELDHLEHNIFFLPVNMAETTKCYYNNWAPSHPASLIFFGPTILLNKLFLDQNFYWLEHFLKTNFVLTQPFLGNKFVGTKHFLYLKLFGPIIILHQDFLNPSFYIKICFWLTRFNTTFLYQIVLS